MPLSMRTDRTDTPLGWGRIGKREGRAGNLLFVPEAADARPNCSAQEPEELKHHGEVVSKGGGEAEEPQQSYHVHDRFMKLSRMVVLPSGATSLLRGTRRC